MIGSYYFWKWAENDLPGRPAEVHATLLRGELHPALQTFDARRLLKKLESARTARRKRGEEWDWEVTPRDAIQQARFVFVTCPVLNESEERARWFAREFSKLGLSGCDEERMQLIPCLSPKLNAFLSGQHPWEPAYDIGEDELPFLIRRIDPHGRAPFGILESRDRGHFVQCYAEGRRFIVEWAQNRFHRGKTTFDQWRAQDPARLAALRGVNEGPQPANKEPDFLRYADTLRIFQAFLRGEARPAQYPWRDISAKLA